MSSLKRYDGELMIDNRCSGDEPPGLPGMGTHFSVPTLACRHCGGVWVINPLRKRAREYCKTCNKYICDTCYGLSKEAGYTHRTIDELTEMVQSGRYEVVGGTVCNPILISTGVK
jgi:hypothetical protein